MKNVLLVTLFLFILSSCNSNSGGSPQTKEQIEKETIDSLKAAPSVSDVSQTIVTNRVQVVKSDISYEEQAKHRHTVGCVTAGSYEAVYQIDPGLKVGSSFLTESASHALGENKSMTRSRNTISAVSTTDIAMQVNFEAFSLEGTPFTRFEDVYMNTPHYTLKSHFIFNGKDYPKTDYDLKGLVENYTPAALAYIKQDLALRTTEWRCNIQTAATVTAGSEYKVDLINYEINGVSKPALLTHSKNVGDVICKQYRRHNFLENTETLPDSKPLLTVNLGPGHSKSVYISTNEYVSMSLLQCGGIQVYSSWALSLDSGKMISSSVEKTLEAPLR